MKFLMKEKNVLNEVLFLINENPIVVKIDSPFEKRISRLNDSANNNGKTALKFC